MSAVRISPVGLALIQDHEGFRSEPAQLPNGQWLVGYGHVRAEACEAVGEAEAARLLTADLAPIEALVNAKVAKPLSQSQFDALVSFAFSIGPESFVQSQVLRRVNAGEFDAAACAMDAWRKSDVSGESLVLSALVRRRAAEKAMLLKDMPHEAAPSALVRAKLDHAASVLGAPIKYSAAPEVGSIPVAQQQPDAAHRLEKIINSEPATNVLLLTQVVTEDASENEIVTAHAKPVPRMTGAASEPPPDHRPRARNGAHLLSGLWSFEGLGFGALLLFGMALIGLGGSLLLHGRADSAAVAGASALTGPGIAAVLMAAWGVARAPWGRRS